MGPDKQEGVKIDFLFLSLVTAVEGLGRDCHLNGEGSF